MILEEAGPMRTTEIGQTSVYRQSYALVLEVLNY